MTTKMNKLFDKVPERLFSPLSGKYKAVYSFCLISLYHLLKMNHTEIRRAEYASFLKSQGEEIMNLFNVADDMQEDKEADDSLPSNAEDDASLLSWKVNYTIRKLSRCGWFVISRDAKKNVDYIFIPAYSIKLMEALDKLIYDEGAYLPLVHQTYSELKLEDEKEDDYMYRSLLNAKNNADSLEMSVTLLRQQILIFGDRLSRVLDPNEAIKQHFDEYRVDVSEKYYHPMKTFDSLGLYAQPTIAILNRWLHSERILGLLINQARTEPANKKREASSIASDIIKLIQSIIDIFSHLSSSFNDIDKVNSNYTEAVRKKVTYLSSSNKTTKGKIDKVIIAIATKIRENPSLDYGDIDLINEASGAIKLGRQGYIDSGSMRMPISKGKLEEDGEPLALDDEMLPMEDANLSSLLEEEANRFSDEAIEEYIERNLNGENEGYTDSFDIEEEDELILMLFGIIKSSYGSIHYEASKTRDEVEHQGYRMPQYKMKRKGGKKNVSR